MGKYKKLYADRKWRRLRKQFLEENPLCWYCQQSGRLTVATVVDHIRPHRGDLNLFWDVRNLRPSCKQCHDAAAQNKDMHGFFGGVGEDGLPLDKDHPWYKS